MALIVHSFATRLIPFLNINYRRSRIYTGHSREPENVPLYTGSHYIHYSLNEENEIALYRQFTLYTYAFIDSLPCIHAFIDSLLVYICLYRQFTLYTYAFIDSLLVYIYAFIDSLLVYICLYRQFTLYTYAFKAGLNVDTITLA